MKTFNHSHQPIAVIQAGCLLAALTGLIFAALAADVDTDPRDKILIAYKLTQDEEAMFEKATDKISDFWSIWTDRSLDYIDMNPETHETWQPPDSYEGFMAGIDDAQMKVMAAWGEKHLYLYFKVTDDDFSDVVIVDGKGRTVFQGTEGDRTAESNNDCVEIRICQNSTEEMAADPASYFPLKSTGDPKNGNPYTMAQYGLRFGGDLPDPDIEIFRRNPSYDPTITDTTHPNSGEYVWQRYNREEEAPEKGFNVKVNIEGANVRIQEWRIRWDQIGMEGSFVKPDPGKMIGALFAYLDVDQGYEFPRADVIYSYQARSTFSWPAGLNAWGDLYFGPELKDAKPIPVLPRGAVAVRNEYPMTNSHYSLTGRTIASDLRSPGVVLKRLAGGIGRKLTHR